MFLNKTTLGKFTYTSANYVTDYESAFENSSITEYLSSDSSKGITYTNMFKNTANLITVNNMNTIVGTAFEGMFENSGIQCIGEINTCNANFPSSWLDCTGDELVCVNEVACVTEYSAYPMLVCTADVDKFGDSTMFNGATGLTTPDVGQQTMITNRFHYEGVNPC